MSKKPPLDFKPCIVCLSPYRRDIEREIKNKRPDLHIARDYLEYLPSKSAMSLRQIINRHKKHLKYENQIMVVNPGDHPAITKTTVESYAKHLLQIGKQMALETPWRFEPKDVIAAQELVIKQKQLNLQENAMKVSLAKMFGGIGLSESEIEEGEIVENEPARKTGEGGSPIQLQTQD